MATSTTEEKGVKREADLDIFGNLSLRYIPTATGNRTTLEVPRKRARELTFIADPHISLVRAGVRTVARTVLAAVIMTLRATSAPAIRATRLEAVPPGEQPTRVRPRKRLGGREKILEEARAERGMTRNWQITPKATVLGF